MIERAKILVALTPLALAGLGLNAAAKDIPAQLPDPDGKAPDATKPVKVYILAGQSNMVGMGDISGARCRYTGIYLTADPAAPRGPMAVGRALYRIDTHGIYLSDDPEAESGATLSIYEGAHDPATDYDKAEPAQTETIALGAAQGALPTLTRPHTLVARGFLDVPESGSYAFSPGFGDSSHNVMKLDGEEVYRKEPGEQALRKRVVLEKGKRYPFEITYFEGGTTAFWMSKLDLVGHGDLEIVTKRDGQFPHLIDDRGEWTVRNDVYYQEARLGFKGSPLTVPPLPGQSTIGPELQFGHIMGYYHDEQVLIIKTAQGNRALAWDFRPPSSGKTDTPGADEWEGLEYQLMIEGVRKTLDQIAEILPNYRGQGYEIAGLAWFQGHKDGGSDQWIAEYEKNLVNLINDVRAEFGAPKMPVVVATVGFGGHGMSESYLRIHQAQMAVGDPEKHPEFAGNVRSVDTRGFWREVDESPVDQGYHYHRNAETYLLVGDALGRAMVELQGGKSEPGSPSSQRARPRPVARQVTPEQPQPDQIAKARAALKPIIVDGMIPRYIGANRAALLNEADAVEPTRVTPFLRGTMYGLTELYRQAGIAEYDWHAFGPDLKNAKWDYYSFDPQETKPKDEGGPRYRKVTYPEGMADWFAVGFDAAKAGWKSGLPPFGQFGGKLGKPTRDCSLPFCGCSDPLRSLWEKEVLLVRRTLDLPPLKAGHRYRIVVGGSAHVNAGEGYAIYINGRQLIEYPHGVGRGQGAQPRGAFIDRGFVKEFQGGKVTIAATSFLKYYHPRDGSIPPQGHFNLWLEEMKIPPLGHAEMVRSATVVPMLSTKWQATHNDDDKFLYDGRFVASPKVLGTWTIIDQVKTVDDFNLEKQMNPGGAQITEITFKDKGETSDMLWIWSGDTLMDLDRNQALKMTVKAIGDRDYLFIEAGGFSTRNPPGWQPPLCVMTGNGR